MSSAPARGVRAHTGAVLPALGLGTWQMGRSPGARAAEVRALRLGLDLGLTLIDTAEMYASGTAESIVGEAVRGRRDGVYLVTKVLPENASRRGTRRACERSLERLATEVIDLYLLHWPGPHPVAETLEAFAELRAEGKIRDYGLSNFDTAGMRAAADAAGGAAIACDQVLYNPRRRGVEWSLLPWCRERGVVAMAYTPLESGELATSSVLRAVGARHGASAAQVALAWALRHPGVVAIPKAGREAHVRELPGALDLVLGAEDLAAIDRAYPPPAGETPLETV